MKRLKASYTIEVSYVLAITLFALSTIIITAYREETRVLLNFVAHTAQEQMLYTDEEYKKDTYNKESITTEGMAYKNISSRFSNAFCRISILCRILIVSKIANSSLAFSNALS